MTTNNITTDIKRKHAERIIGYGKYRAGMLLRYHKILSALKHRDYWCHVDWPMVEAFVAKATA